MPVSNSLTNHGPFTPYHSTGLTDDACTRDEHLVILDGGLVDIA